MKDKTGSFFLTQTDENLKYKVNIGMSYCPYLCMLGF